MKIQKKLINIEEKSNIKLIIKRDIRIFSDETYLKWNIISLFCILTFIFFAITLFYFELMAYEYIFIPIIIIFACLFFFMRDNNKIQRLIIDKMSQRIIYYDNYLKPNKVKEYDTKICMALEVKSYLESEDFPWNPHYEIYLRFSNNKMQIFDKMTYKEDVITISKELIKYLNINFISIEELGVKKAVINEDIFTDFFYCLYCGNVIERDDNTEYCIKCGSEIQNKLDIEKLNILHKNGVSIACPSCGDFYLFKEILFKRRYKRRKRIVFIVKCIFHNSSFKIILPYEFFPNDFSLKMYRIIAGNMLKCEKCGQLAILTKYTSSRNNYLFYIKCSNHGIQKRLISSVFFSKIEEIFRESKEITNINQLKEE